MDLIIRMEFGGNVAENTHGFAVVISDRMIKFKGDDHR